MIDVESEIFTLVATALRAAFPGVYVAGDYVKIPPSLPCVMILEFENVPYRRTQTTSSQENHVAVIYDVNVYSNKTVGKKTEARSLLKVADDVLLGIGFNRSFTAPLPNYDDSTIYRLNARYEAIISKEKVIYRRT